MPQWLFEKVEWLAKRMFDGNRSATIRFILEYFFKKLEGSQDVVCIGLDTYTKLLLRQIAQASGISELDQVAKGLLTMLAEEIVRNKIKRTYKAVKSGEVIILGSPDSQRLS